MYLLVLHMLMVDLGGVLMLFLMRLRIGIHQMVLPCFTVLLMFHMCYIVSLVKLLLLMWDLSVRRVRLAFVYQNLMWLT
jgi:hypothetical protein